VEGKTQTLFSYTLKKCAVFYKSNHWYIWKVNVWQNDLISTDSRQSKLAVPHILNREQARQSTVIKVEIWKQSEGKIIPKKTMWKTKLLKILLVCY
jgi:hypothetical protein